MSMRERGPRALSIAAALTVAAGIAVFAVSDRRRIAHQSQPPSIAALASVAQQSSSRRIEPRLSNAFPYKPFRRDLRSGTAPRPVVPGFGGDRHAMALGYLLAGDTTYSIALLKELLRGDAEILERDGVTRADVFAELASAEYERGMKGDAKSLAAAFEDAARALSLAPAHPGALHVRALTLEALYLREDAIDAWKNYLAQDPGSAWAVEARAHLRALAEQPPHDPSEALVRAADTGDAATLKTLIDGRPQYARALVEETLLGAWGDAIAAHDEAAAGRALRRARVIGMALANVSDRMGFAAVEQIERGDVSRSRLAAAHRAYTAARAASVAASDEKACDALGEAASMLTAMRSPLALRAWIAHATISHYLGRSDEARAVLTGVTDSLRGSEADYPVATGEAWWMLGLVEQSQGRSAAALHDYEKARVALERAQEASHIAGISAVLAETYRYLGDFDRAWSTNIQALRWADAGGTYKRRQIVANDAALLAIESGYPQLAERIAQRMVRRAATSRDEIFAVLGLLDEGRALAARQRLADARTVLDRAAVRLDALPRNGSTLRLIADVAATRGELATRSDPVASIQLINTAFRQLQDLNHRSRLARLHLVMARAKRAAGDEIGEERELAAGIVQLESQRDHLDDDQERSTFTDTGRALYDDSVRLLIAREQPGHALQVVRRARTIGVTTPGGLASDAMSGGAAVPAGAAFVEYYLLGDTLLTWVTANGTTELITSTTPAIRDAVRRDVAAFRHCTVASTCISEATRLFDLLIAPARRAIGGARELLIAPDGVLHLVPFAALYDAREKHFVAEDYVVSVVLSAQPPAPDRGRFANIFVTAAPAPDDLPALRAATAEADAVARLFRSATLLRGREATAARFLADAARHDAAHFAGHAVWNEQHPRLAALRFAPDAKHADGALHADELRGIDPGRTRLVVLAACDTARGELTSAGALSFARAFAASGVPSVIGSLWPVDDEASKRFFITFYGALTRGQSPGESLRAAQRDLIAAPNIGPAEWAAFQLYVGSKRMTERGKS